jgi:hypothetical protein
MRQWTGSQLMMMMLGWVVTWSTHYPILVRSTIEWNWHSLLLLALFVSMDGVIHDDGFAY